jgi:hypothetical protein
MLITDYRKGSGSARFTCLTKQRFRECGKANAYSANIEFHFNAHGEDFRERKAPTENSNREREGEGDLLS